MRKECDCGATPARVYISANLSTQKKGLYLTEDRQMSRKTKITKNAVIKRLQDKQAYGQSRHEGKKDGTAAHKIYSYNTYNTYRKQVSAYYDYVYQRTRGNIPDEAVFALYVQEYIDRYTSAWSQKTALAAMRKAGLPVPQVRTLKETRASIRKNRGGAPGVSTSIHDTTIELCKIAGLRRHEIPKARADNLKVKNGIWYLDGIKGKGGKVRNIRLLRAPSDRLKHALSAGLDAPPEAVNVHIYRRGYAQEIYSRYLAAMQAAGKKITWIHLRKEQAGVKICREAALYTSRQLGHNRVDVVVRNYLL